MSVVIMHCEYFLSLASICVNNTFMNTLYHWLIYSFIKILFNHTHSFINPFIRKFKSSYTHSYILSYIHTQMFIHSFIRSLTPSYIHSFKNAFNCFAFRLHSCYSLLKLFKYQSNPLVSAWIFNSFINR